MHEWSFLSERNQFNSSFYFSKLHNITTDKINKSSTSFLNQIATPRNPTKQIRTMEVIKN